MDQIPTNSATSAAAASRKEAIGGLPLLVGVTFCLVSYRSRDGWGRVAIDVEAGHVFMGCGGKKTGHGHTARHGDR